MHAFLVMALVSSVGIEVGWEPLVSGGHEYTIQLEPQLLDILKSGSDVVSEVPDQLSVRRYRITIGTGKLPRIDGDPQPPSEAPKFSRRAEEEPEPSLPSTSLPPVSREDMGRLANDPDESA